MKISTYVTGYYYVPKPNLPHMGLGRYLALAPGTLRMISGGRLFFFYEDEFLASLFSVICKEQDIDLKLIQLPLENLPMREYAERIAKNASMPNSDLCAKFNKREKGVAHVLNLCDGQDRTPYLGNLSIWLSKISLVNRVLASECEGDLPGIAWVDIGISKMNYRRSNWEFAKLAFSGKAISHYGSNMRYMGNKLPLNASFLAGDPRSWRRLIHIFEEELADASLDGYPHDEETVLKRVCDRAPELFERIGEPDEGTLGKTKHLLRRIMA